MLKTDINPILQKYGEEGVHALMVATPKESGLASTSWTYKVASDNSGFSISWYNTDIESGFPVAVMLQYGYSTGTGGYVQGKDYINPVAALIFDRISAEVWKAVNS